ncbi:MAG: alpha/beta hydrolase [Nevskia sp.]|nr:alpha/beta hydrolase [Nevskia sp.]
MGMKSHIVVAATLFTTLLLAACSGAQFINAITPDSGYRVERGEAYDAADGLRLDVYVPDGARDAPLVLFFYGGSWQAGKSLDRSAYKFVGQALAQQGFVAMIADYRLYPQVRYPAFLDDCARALVWAHAHAAAYGADPAKLVVMGHSAGAYNAAMLALDPDLLRRSGGDRAWLRGMVGLAGPYDFLPITDPVLQELFGPRESWPLTQPIHYADGSGPPLLLLAGDDDDVVYVKNTNNLYERIRGEGGAAEKVTYPRMGHVKIIALMASRLPGHQELIDHVAGFVRGVTAVPAPQRAADAQARLSP